MTAGTFEVSPPQDLARLRTAQHYERYFNQEPKRCVYCGTSIYDRRLYGRHVATCDARPPEPVKKRKEKSKQLDLFRGRGGRR